MDAFILSYRMLETIDEQVAYERFQRVFGFRLICDLAYFALAAYIIVYATPSPKFEACSHIGVLFIMGVVAHVFTAAAAIVASSCPSIHRERAQRQTVTFVVFFMMCAPAAIEMVVFVLVLLLPTKCLSYASMLLLGGLPFNMLCCTAMFVWERAKSYFARRGVYLQEHTIMDPEERFYLAVPTRTIRNSRRSARQSNYSVYSGRSSRGSNSGSSSGGEECSICLCGFRHRQTLATLPCRHQFHDHCLSQWFAKGGTCPLCRGEMRAGVENKV